MKIGIISDIPPNWNDIRSTVDIPKLCEIARSLRVIEVKNYER